MNNEIERKTTSLILMTIMVAGGLTFAIPSTVPDAHAQTPNLYVSAVNPAFENTFGGLQVVEVIVNDPVISDQRDSDPRVTVDGTTLDMYQGDDGSWYGYFRSATNAAAADALWDSDTPANAPDQSELVRTLPSGVVFGGNDMIVEFDLDGDFDVVYHKAGAPQTVSITYDDSTNNAINIDRTSYPRNAHVHVDISDHVLNIDPTSVDVWRFAIDNDGNPTYAGGTGDNDNNVLANPIAPTMANLGCEDDDCSFSIEDIGAADTNNIITLDGNPTTYTLEETGANTGVFTITNDDESIIMIQDNAPRNQNTDITYSDETASVQVSFNTADVKLSIADGIWNSGEPIDLTVVDADQNMNSQVDEDQTIDNPDARIPIFMTGDPYTLVDGFDPPQGRDDMDIYAYEVTTRPNSITYEEEDHDSSTRLDYRVDDNHRGIISVPANADLDTPRIAIPFGTFGELRQSINDDNLNNDGTFVGRNLINYDFSVFGDEDIRSDIMLVNDDGDVIRYGTVGMDHNALTAYDPPADIRDITGWGLAPTGGTNLHIAGPQILAEANINDNTDVILVLTLSIDLNPNEPTEYPIVTDFFSFGFYGDGVQASERVANQIIRVEVEETGDNTSTFTGTLEYVMINQLDAAVDDALTLAKDNVYANIEPISNEATFIAFEDLTGSDARVNYNDLNANGNDDTIVSAQQDITTSTGVVSLKEETYSVGSNVVITLEDGDLNTDSGSRETYTVVTTINTPGININDEDKDQVGINVGDLARTPAAGDQETLLPGGNSLGMLLEVTFDGERWQEGPAACTLPAGTDNGLGDSGFTLQETGPATGIFTGSFAIPSHYCIDEDGDNIRDDPETTRGKDISITYLDFRDASGQIVTAGDSAAIGASTGSISLDRTVYPVPFGNNPDTDDPYRFNIHPTAGEDDDDMLPEGIVTAYIQVNDPDFNLNPTGTDRIAEADPGTGAPAPVLVTITRGGNQIVLGYAGSAETEDDRELYVGNTNAAITAIRAADTAGTDVPVPLLGPMTETSPESGIFEIALDIQYTDGPQGGDCENSPVNPNSDTAGNTFADDRIFSDANTNTDNADNFCILQGDILTVQYTDPADASGNERTVTDSATFDLRNGALQTDKSVYVIGTDMIVTLIDPDLDLDSNTRETHTLDLIEWDSDGGTETLSNDVFDAATGLLQETGDSTGIFQAVMEIPEEIDDRLQRGEEIKLEYIDWGPSGADFVGDNSEEIRRTIFTSNFGATIELDQAVYTWTDKVFITITAPDHNLNSNQVDEIGDDDDQLRVATREDDIDDYTLVETGTDTGIFTGEVILIGFDYDVDGDGTDDTDPNRDSGTGPTDGLLESNNDDGLEVSYEFSEDEFVRKTALIRWNIGEVQWLEASYPATSSGVLRVIDADMNLNPESVDNFEVRVWSSSSVSGITLTVTETQPASGIFEGTVFFGYNVASGGHRLNVQEGDTVTARYDDRTLPDPYNRGDSESITATTIIGTIVPPLERVGIESLRAVDATGTALSTVAVDQQIQISADITNKQDKDQPFAYLVQIQDADGVTVSLSWIDGSLTPNQSLSPSVSWTPTTPGTYTVTVFAWESVSTPTALSPQQQTTITVN